MRNFRHHGAFQILIRSLVEAAAARQTFTGSTDATGEQGPQGWEAGAEDTDVEFDNDPDVDFDEAPLKAIGVGIQRVRVGWSLISYRIMGWGTYRLGQHKTAGRSL